MLFYLLHELLNRYLYITALSSPFILEIVTLIGRVMLVKVQKVFSFVWMLLCLIKSFEMLELKNSQVLPLTPNK